MRVNNLESIGALLELFSPLGLLIFELIRLQIPSFSVQPYHQNKQQSVNLTTNTKFFCTTLPQNKQQQPVATEMINKGKGLLK